MKVSNTYNYIVCRKCKRPKTAIQIFCILENTLLQKDTSVYNLWTTSLRF